MSDPERSFARRNGGRSSPTRVLVGALAGYLLGSVPSADLAARLAGGDSVDLRKRGSGNPGTLNAASVLGNRWGLAVLASDVAKGAIAGFAGRAVGGDSGSYAAATCAVVGHVLPPLSGFRGGKGVATSAGACLAAFPAYSPIDLAVAVSSAVGSGSAETSVRLSCTAWVLAALLWSKRGLPNGWGPRPGPGLVLFAAASSAVMLAKFALTRTGAG